MLGSLYLQAGCVEVSLWWVWSLGLVTCASCSLSRTGSITETCAAGEGSQKSWGWFPHPPPLPPTGPSRAFSATIPLVMCGDAAPDGSDKSEFSLLCEIMNCSITSIWLLPTHATSVYLCEQQKEKFTYWMCIITRKGAYFKFFSLNF